jgi:hypothetical protein
MEDQITILGISKDELVALVKEAVKQEFSRQRAMGEAPKSLEADRYLTRSEVCNLLNVSHVTLNNWSKRDVLIPRKIGGRVLYLKNEVFEKLDSVA